MPVSILPEANYVTSSRNRIRVYALHDFVACIDTTWNGCIPSIHNKPYADLEPSETANEYYLAFGFSSEYYMNLKVFRVVSNFTVEDAYLMIAIWTGPDNKQHILYKIGVPIDVPSADKIWLVMKDGRVLYAEAPIGIEDFVQVGTVDNTFFLVQSDVTPPVIVKPKIGWATVALILGLAGIASATWWAVETHKTDREAEVKQYATDKYYEFLNNVTNMVKSNPELADPFTAILETLHGSMAITWQMPPTVNPHQTTQNDTSPWDKFVGWLQQNWQYLVLPIIGTIILVFKWRAILDFIRDLFSSLRERFRR